MNRLHKIFFTIIFLHSTTLISQEISPIQNYTPEIYNAENQNWAITQGENNFIYAANNKGLLEFDGANWNIYSSPNNSIIRSVNAINDKIYTGCYMEFGYWKKDATGSLTYTSLSQNPQIKLLEDEEFWKILKVNEWILFQSLNRIYIYNSLDKSFNIIDSDTTLENTFKVNNTIYYQKINDGFYQITKGKSRLVNDNPILKNNRIVGVYLHEKNLLVVTEKDGFFKIIDNKLVKWKTKNDSKLSEIVVYSSIETSDSNFILGTISQGIFQIDNKGNIICNINQEQGLNNNTVLNLFEDEDKNIWAGLDNGISCINFNSPFKVYYDKKGKLGTTYASVVHDNLLYLGTNQGLFWKTENSDNDFQLIEGTKGQVWSLKVIDNQLFCGHHLGTFIINKNQASQISNKLGTWKFELLPDSNNTIIQGNYNGFFVLKKENDDWKFSHKIKGFDISSRYFQFISKNKILTTHEYKGIYELQLNSELTKFSKVKIDSSLKGEESSLVTYQNEQYYFFNKGFYKYNSANSKFEIAPFLDENIRKNEIYNSGKLVHTNNHKLWAFSNKNLIFLSPGKLNDTPELNKIFLPIELRKDYTGFENISHIKEEKYLLGTSFGYLLVDTEKLSDKKHTIQLTKVTKSNLNNLEKITTLNNKTNIYSYNENYLNFYFSVPTYNKYTEVTYKYILEGRYNHWGDWTTKPFADFKNLPFGDYTFRAKAKIGNIESDNEISYSFTIERPWYLSNIMLILYFSTFVLILYLVHGLNKRHYKRQKQAFLLKKQREFERSQLEKEKEIMKLRNDKLRTDIEGKNRELAASTMSIIKKNEFLNSIKKDLSDLEKNEFVKPIIKIIDKNLNNTSDWELFQEAFNNADKDFLIKVKERHPSLTPNDLRLCAYLRLNLSSKEIAPLLNISHKSVEIKRYRLRKKMGLTKKENLIHHILEI